MGHWPEETGSFFQGLFSHLGVGHRRNSPPLAQLVVALDQHVNAVGAEQANDDCADGAHDVAGLREGIGHGQDTGAQTAFQQMEQCFRVAEKYDSLDSLSIFF